MVKVQMSGESTHYVVVTGIAQMHAAHSTFSGCLDKVVHQERSQALVLPFSLTAKVNFSALSGA